ncbi:MAG: TetM/TetW/TetO/TetS family tetracycline resistance ribosomal protection protein [Eubacterium sp.]|nr:TetM/TetW/TetO/TetS family tetracycline resistance ribosomal protection protein [Eubacterium sp.]
MNNKPHTVIGILAHVDAGKTTLSEGILYKTGTIRKAGRVDHGDAFLDTEALEKQRGITIFSKQAEFSVNGKSFTLLDTPGHVDFSPEMERTLQVLDCAVLVISAPEGVNGRVRQLWKLLEHYEIPVILFINKMDQPGTGRAAVLEDLQNRFGEGCIDFQQNLQEDDVQEQIAVCDENVLASYLEGEQIGSGVIRSMVRQRKLFPCFFGAALQMEGIDDLLAGLAEYAEMPKDSRVHEDDAFAARVFKITRDQQGMRLTWIRLLGGTLKVKSMLQTGADGSTEKVDQIRIYSGSGYEMVQELEAGRIAALTGLEHSFAGQGLGSAPNGTDEILQPVYNSTVILRDEGDRPHVLQALRILEEEEPLLRVTVNEDTKEMQVGIMGEVQTQILQQILEKRFGLPVRFGEGKIAYRETIADVTEGVGHFEPLRHYAEVHLLMEPGEPGSGLQFAADCSTDLLALNWQRLILTHLEERDWQGVLTGSELTDVKITVIGGRAHEKHTEGGDFRQATYRAVRQGLMTAKSVLLEPVYQYEIRLPAGLVGRAMTDMERMGGTINPPETAGEEAVLTGTVPASELLGYQTELTSYTGGAGQLTTSVAGFFPCHNADAVIAEQAYDPDADTANPSGSVFCSHGAGVIIPWDAVREYMHVDTGWRPGMRRADDGGWIMPDDGDGTGRRMRDAYGGTGADADDLLEQAVSAQEIRLARQRQEEASLSFKEREQRRGAAEKELKEIFERTYGTVRTQSGKVSGTLDRTEDPDDGTVYDQAWRDYRRQQKNEKKTGPNTSGTDRKKNRTGGGKQRCLLVDGYNIIFAWEHLKKLAQKNIDSARDALMDILSDYQGYDGCTLILVFDAYKVRGGERHILKYHNINVVYTKEAETADAYIEKTVHEISRNYEVTVATSDSLEQMIILGAGAARISAKELEKMTARARREAKETFAAGRAEKSLSRLLDHVQPELAEQLEEIRRGEKQERPGKGL